MAETLKKLILHMYEPRLADRRKVFEEFLSKQTDEAVLPPAGIKFALKHMQNALLIFDDNTSRRLVVNVVGHFSKIYPDSILKYLSVTFSTVVQQLCLAEPNPGFTKASVFGVWIISHGLLQIPDDYALNEENAKDLLITLSILVNGSFAVERASLRKCVERKMTRLWDKRPSLLKLLCQTMSHISPNISVVCTLSLICKYLRLADRLEELADSKAPFLQHLMKTAFLVKDAPSVAILKASKFLLQVTVTHGNFKSEVMTVLHKAILRSPEISMQGVALVLGALSIDLGSYAQELTKPMASQLKAQSEGVRHAASLALASIARQCSDPEAVELLVRLVHGVLMGSEGKVTANEIRMDLVTTLGDLASNGVTGGPAAERLAGVAVDLLTAYVQHETNEASIVLALSQLSKWLQKFTTSLPETLIPWFKSNGFLPKSSNTIRIAYLQCINAAFLKNDLLELAEPLIPSLLESVSRGTRQSTLPLAMSEAVCAGSLLISLASLQAVTDPHGADTRYEAFWSALLNKEKLYFFNERLLNSVPDTVLACLIIITERLIVEHSMKMSDEFTVHVMKTLLHCLTHPSFVIVRKPARLAVKRIVSGLSGADVASRLVKVFQDAFLQELAQTIADASTASSVAASIDDDASTSAKGSLSLGKRLCDALVTIISVPVRHEVDEEERAELAVQALYPANHPLLVEHDARLWDKIVSRLSLKDTSFLDDRMESMVHSFIAMDIMNEMQYNALVCLVRYLPSRFGPCLQFEVLPLMDAPEFRSATLDDVGIMNTPDGVLYNKQMIESLTKYEESTANVRRENKLYSYKEQMLDLELRKEMEAKKKKQQNGGRGKAESKPQFTKKQQEMVDAELAKEKETRERVKKVDSRLNHYCRLLTAAVEGCPVTMSNFLGEIVPTVRRLLSAPLSAPHATRLMVKLVDAAYVYEEDLGSMWRSLCPHWLVRMTEPKIDWLAPAILSDPLFSCHKRWLDEPLELQTRRVIDKLEHCVTKNMPISNLHFCYLFPGLRRLISSWCANSRMAEAAGGDGDCAGDLTWMWVDTDMLKQVLHICIEQAGQRNPSMCAEAMSVDPGSLPHSGLFETLSELVECSSKQAVQAQAQHTMFAVAEAISGDDDCAYPYPEAVSALLLCLRSGSSAVRESVLKCLLKMVTGLKNMLEDATVENLHVRLWIACHDVDENNSKMALELWSELELVVDRDLCMALLPDVAHQLEPLRLAAGAALAKSLEGHEDQMDDVLSKLFETYTEKLYIPPPVMDDFNRVVLESPPDQWESRSGLAHALGQLCSCIGGESVGLIFHFLVPNALNDRDERVRGEMLKTALDYVEKYGQSHLGTLLPIMEDFLNSAPNTADWDPVRRSVVILTGSLAKHLESGNPKVTAIFGKLLESLNFPSQQVQEAVSNCMPPLVTCLGHDEQKRVIERLMHVLLESTNYAERKGAAYGIAGVVKGLGILSLKQNGIMDTLIEAVQDKTNPRHRESALFAFEMQCLTLGRLFEPYVVKIIPHLLVAFGDNNTHVRAAADEAARAVMSKLSAHGVKLILPSLVNALEEDSWRTKTGSVELLGSMAYCAPKQLSACLPQIVPRLMEVLTDSHLRVQKAGAQALQQIGNVIKNPEIQVLVPLLLDALQDPIAKTTVCLQGLLNTEFVHFIDAPSLALIMPVVTRAFKDRSTETRKMAAQIIGNMYSLTDKKDLEPYVDSMQPGLKACLLDPVPEVRSVASRALGAMVKGMGETCFKDLLPWLMATLTTDSSSVDRSGAAQGLAEVVGGMGKAHLEKFMSEIMETAGRTEIQPHVRDGYIMLYIYLPGVFLDDFAEYVGPILPSIIKALSDENEYVRESALRAGQRIVQLYADKAIALLLPEVEKGMLDDNWRIRHSSVQLLGDLLFKVSGVTGKGTTEGVNEDDTFGTASSQSAIMRKLGKDRRDHALARLYMLRSDTSHMVRQAATHVWKVVVSNTPRTLREIMPILFQLLLACLAAEDHDKRQVAARTLGDIVRKLGERVLPDIIPILEKGLESDDPDQRQGVCIGLCEIMRNSSKEQVQSYAEDLIPCVRQALYDSDENVRHNAAVTFDELHSNIGIKALEEILPDLMSRLDEPEISAFALDGLRELLAVKGRAVMPYLVPQLTTPIVNTRAFSFLAAVAGDSLTRHLNKLIPALLKAIKEVLNTETLNEEVNRCATVILSISEEHGIRALMNDLNNMTGRDDTERTACMLLLGAYIQRVEDPGFEDPKHYLPDFYPNMIRAALKLFNSRDTETLTAGWTLIDTLVKKWGPKTSPEYAIELRQAVRTALGELRQLTGGRSEVLPGFCLKNKGVGPFLDVYKEAIFSGNMDIKETSAAGMGECIAACTSEALGRSALKVAGPLIRAMGDRYSTTIKGPIIETLGVLLIKCTVMMKPFVAQLQATFEKALNDPSRPVRLKAAAAIGNLASVTDKIDKLLTDVLSKECGDDAGYRDTSLYTLRCAIEGGGSRIKPETQQELLAGLSPMLDVGEDRTRVGAAACLGALCAVAPEDPSGMLTGLLKGVSTKEWLSKHGRAVMMMVGLKITSAKLIGVELEDPELADKRIATVHEFCLSDKLPVCQMGYRALGHILGYLADEGLGDKMQASLQVLSRGMKHDSWEVKMLCAQICSYVAMRSDSSAENVRLYARTMLALLINGTREKHMNVRNTSEQAIVALVRLRRDQKALPGPEGGETEWNDSAYKICLECIDGGMKGSLIDIVTKFRKRSQHQNDDPFPELDDTRLK